MEELQVFNEQVVLGKNFRIFGDKDNPLFLAKDVAEWIDYSQIRPGTYKTSQMIEPVHKDEKLVTTIKLPGDTQRRQHWFLTEEGLYECLMLGRTEICHLFKKEVKRILKQIRQTGGMVVEGREDEFIQNYFPSFSDEVKLAMALDLKKQNEQYKQQLEQQRQELLEKKRQIKEQKQTIEEQKPMVEFTNTVLKSKDNILVRQLAKIAQSEGIDLGERKLYNKLREWGMIFKNSTEPYQRYITDGTFVVEEKPVETAYTVILAKTTKVTPIGQVRIIERLKKELQ